uniref:Uncharacterized protein n=1 Tax=Arundo donax TaxID=35708 RepID=A0A0A9F0C7_ARUDO
MATAKRWRRAMGREEEAAAAKSTA